LLENDIPIIMVYGDSDDVVPYEENGKLLEEFYKKGSGKLVAIGKAGCGHHPHGLSDNSVIVEFARGYSK
jgi:predicted esterase